MEEMQMENTQAESTKIEGRNAVLEAFRSGKPVDKLYVLDGCQDGAVRSIIREARKHDTILNFVEKDRLNQLSETGKHQGVIAVARAVVRDEEASGCHCHGSSIFLCNGRRYFRKCQKEK